jgi:hypothetical protein
MRHSLPLPSLPPPALLVMAAAWLVNRAIGFGFLPLSTQARSCGAL